MSYICTYGEEIISVKYGRCKCIGSLWTMTQHTISKVVHNQVKLGNQLVHYMCKSEPTLRMNPSVKQFRLTDNVICQ